MNEKINIHVGNGNVEARLSYVQDWNVPESVKVELKEFLEDLGSGKVNKGVQVAPRTQVKYISLLRHPLIFFNKSINEITKDDLERFDSAINKDKLKSEKKKPFSANMKKDMRIALRVLLKWKFGNAKAMEITDFFDTKDVKKTPNYLKETQIEKMYKGCKTAQERFIVAVLFDSGARAEELLNIREEDLELPEGKSNYPKLTLKEEYSKTEGRTISLYWPKSLEAVRDFVQERKMEGIKRNEPLIALTYDAVRFFVRALAMRTLQQPVHLHLFRHSSATYYASKMNRQELCYRYGWAFSSRMPDVYISRAGVMNKELDEKFSGAELETLKRELELERQKNAMEIERIRQERFREAEKIVDLANAIHDLKQKVGASKT